MALATFYGWKRADWQCDNRPWEILVDSAT